MSLLRNEIENSLITKKDHPNFGAGDTITVYYKIKEGDKERIQFFKGDVIGIKDVKNNYKKLIFKNGYCNELKCLITKVLKRYHWKVRILT